MAGELADLLDLQRTAGNRAVTTLVAGGRDVPDPDRASRLSPPGQAGTLQRIAGHPAIASRALASAPVGDAVQRAPDDRSRDRSQAALGDTLPGAAPTPSGPGPTVASPDALATTIPGVGSPPPAFDKNAPLRGQAVPVTQSEVEAAYRRDPGSVIRSPNANWHSQIYVLDKGTGGIPGAFRVGNQIAVHPDYPGPATPLPAYAAIGNVGLGGGQGTAGPALPTVEPRIVGSKAETVGAGADSVAPQARPEGERKPQPRKWNPEAMDKARPISFKEVRAAYRADPASVIRSPSQYWHEQMYEFDQGSGDYYPRAFKVGNQVVVAPDYPGKATPLPQYSADGNVGLGPQGARGGAGGAPTGTRTAPIGGTGATGGTTGPSNAAKATNVIGLPGTVYDAGTRGQHYTATVTQQGDQTTVRDRKRELGTVTTGEETTTGDLSHRKERTVGAGFGVGGNVVGAQYGRTESTRIGEDVGVTTSGQVTAGISGEGKVQIGGERKREVRHGTRPDGTPVTTSTGTSGGITVDAGSIGGNVGTSYTGKSGREVTGGASFTIDDKGNSSASLTGGVKSKGGYGASVTISGSHTVTADDPEEVSPGVWEVRFVVGDSSSVGGGVSGKAGPVGVGVSGSVTDADTKVGSRRFKTEKEAKEFKEHAADRIARDGSLGFFPVTTIPGALAIPIGESRGIGGSHTKSGGVSGTFGATISKSGQTSSAHELSVFRAAATTVHVTYTIVGSEGSDWGISGGLSNQKGSSESSLWALTYEFNLGSKEGADAFLRFVAIPLPPMTGARRVSVRTLMSQEDHDKYALVGGTSEWSGTTWQGRVENDRGTQEQYGGKQSRNQDPGRVWKFLGDKELHSNAQIVRSQENDKDVGARAEFSISGESGSFNRDEFRKIFQDSRYAEATASGKWTLSAPVPMATIRQLEAVNPRMRAAKTLDEKMLIYSELVKANGAQMLGGQVGITSKSWDLELKGDENFPGPAGRARLNQERKALADALKAKPPKADEVVRQSGEVLGTLQKRRAAVADRKRYTDLPDGLRKQQLALIDGHIDAFRAVRRNAQALAMRKPDGAGSPTADPAYTRLQARVSASEVSIGKLRKEIRTTSKALGDAIGAKGSTAVKAGLDRSVAEVQIAAAKTWIATATSADKSQAALDPKIDQLREAWTGATSGKDRLTAVTALAQVLDERVKLMHQVTFAIREAAKAVYPITTRQAMAGNPAFWASLGMAEEEPPQPVGAPSMRL